MLHSSFSSYNSWIKKIAYNSVHININSWILRSFSSLRSSNPTASVAYQSDLDLLCRYCMWMWAIRFGGGEVGRGGGAMGVRNVLELVAMIFFVRVLSFFVVLWYRHIITLITSRRLSAVNSPNLIGASPWKAELFSAWVTNTEQSHSINDLAPPKLLQNWPYSARAMRKHQ
jgi:hypothetical protein